MILYIYILSLPNNVCLTSNFLLAQIITASSSPQLAKFPSYRTVNPLTGNLCPISVFISYPVNGFQILMVLSAEPVAILLSNNVQQQ